MESTEIPANFIEFHRRKSSDRISLEEVVPIRTEISLPGGDALKVRNGYVTRRPSQQVAEIGTDIVRYPLVPLRVTLTVSYKTRNDS